MHVATLWQITTAADTLFASVLVSVFDTTPPLTSVPAIGGLMPSTDYLARAQYYADDGTISAWSATVPFTTLANNTIDQPGTFAPADQGCSDC